ncbi:hypothetical protein FCL47_17690 [Desulfopila sp. IMCC35006]|uniref:hypothetical protein n=1 Tax=Desulfopila sp. IMCC35006 TaxID=2569542 RepID=UPI0010AB9C4E|nr:hypothetical protein [Desulfopila sp. IMCC35006]TKB24664.1 hypothetical protein FCL47_17690 [Desulfopila sp. IMCC35006]
MRKIEQLVGLCRTTLQRMENSGDIVSALLRSDQIFALCRCSSLDDLLRTLSLSDDRGLLRRVAERRDEVPGRQENIAREAGATLPLHQPPRQEALSQPAGSTLSPLTRRQTAPELPGGSYSSSHSQQIVQKLFESIKQELAIEQKQGETSSRSVAFKGIPAAEEKNGLRSLKAMTGGSQRLGFSADPGQSNASSPFSAMTREGERTGWLDNHPRHKTAAAALLDKDLEPFVSEKTLRKWAAPLPADDGLNETNLVRQDKKRGVAGATSPHRSPSRPEERGQENTATGSREIRPFHTAAPGSGNTAPFFQPEHGSSSSLRPENPSSQLEQLVRKWQSGSPSAEKNTRETTAVPFRQNTDLSAAKGAWNSIVREQQSPLDTDHVFAETLERVLKREMRRHGIEEEP